MKDKFNLTREQNIFLAKKTIVENIYNSAKLEGCNVTFPQTKTILEGVNDRDVTLLDIQKITNLKSAWDFNFQNINSDLDLNFICEINKRVSHNESIDWGVLRYGEVGISGTNYIPKIPIKSQVEEQLNIFLKIECVTERAIKIFLWSMREQLFWDGNKRTSLIVANKILITEGKGILTIKEENIPEFNKRLSDFYSTNDYSVIDDFLFENCIFGLVLNNGGN